MKKIIINLCILTIFITTLIGCSHKVPEDFDLTKLTRVDVYISKDEQSDHEVIITEDEKIKTLRKIFAKIEWEQNIKVEMTRKEDVKATLFFSLDKNMPETLFEYFIWFNQGDISATIIDRENNAMGTLEKEYTQTLKDILVDNNE